MDAHKVTVNTIKGLAMDAVQAANSGHPGMPMGCADLATVLWSKFLKHDPSNPSWPDRDRFVLSAGHGSMLLYSLLHLSGYDLPLQEIKDFRQWGSKTPGHPEFGHTVGVECTTGPLGQGFAMGAGMALAERVLRETFGAELTDHYTYAIVSDGDLMEGVASEAASLAGHLGLGRMIYLYDDNEITIDGDTGLSFGEDRAKRFDAYGWHTIAVDGHDPQAIANAIVDARAETKRPSLILCRTVIGQSSALEGTSKTHGAPLGAPEVAATKSRLGMDPTVAFATPQGAYDHMQGHEGAAAREAWQARLDAHPRKDEFLAWLNTDPADLAETVEWPTWEAGTKIATRKASAACLKALTAAAPQVIGGSADLAGSNGTDIGAKIATAEDMANVGTVAFGVREHAMAAMCNGLALHGGVIPYCATFMMFHDYMRPSVRLSALMGQQVVYVYTHDSIFLGEDGPTHQPVETLMAMRATPGVRVFRPADGAETVEAWKAALRYTDGPTAIVLTRQGLPNLDRTLLTPATEASKGAYVLQESEFEPDVVLIATGSEVPLALEAAEILKKHRVASRVVSAPCLELLMDQSGSYIHHMFPPGAARVSIEAGVTFGWQSVVGLAGLSIGIDSFGASAPAQVLAEQFGLTAQLVADRVRGHIGK